MTLVWPACLDPQSMLRREARDLSFSEKFSSLSEFMSRASRLIKRLDKALNGYESFGDNPDSFVETVMSGLETELGAIRSKDKPELWAEICVERDRARIKQAVLNRAMGQGSD